MHAHCQRTLQGSTVFQEKRLDCIQPKQEIFSHLDLSSSNFCAILHSQYVLSRISACRSAFSNSLWLLKAEEK